MDENVEFETKVERGKFCWIWKGKVNRKWKKPLLSKKHGRRIWAHRYAFEKKFGPIPPKGMIFRTCGHPLCVNPDHMELVMPGQTQPQHRNEPEIEHIRSIMEETHDLCNLPHDDHSKPSPRE